MKFHLVLVAFLIVVIAANSLPKKGSKKHAKHTKTRFSIPQKAIKNFLNHKSVIVEIKATDKTFSFPSFISRNSRGLLIDLVPAAKHDTDETGFFKEVITTIKDSGISQALLDFRLIDQCKFASTMPNKRLTNLQFDFSIEGKSTSKKYNLIIKFNDTIRKGDLLVNDEKEFADTLFQLKRSCISRKNQLRNRKAWFINKGDAVFQNVKKLGNGLKSEERAFGANSPYNLDKQIKKLHQLQKEATTRYLRSKNKAQLVSNRVADFGVAILQAQKDYQEVSKREEKAKCLLEEAKLNLEKKKMEFDQAKYGLMRGIPQERKRIEEVANEAKNMEHEIKAMDLKIAS